MFGEKACSLIKELSRCEEVLPPYNVSATQTTIQQTVKSHNKIFQSDLVKEVCTEIKQLDAQNRADGYNLVYYCQYPFTCGL